MHTVATIAYDSVNPFELAVATEIFGLERPELGVSWYRFLVCAVEPRPIHTSVGMLISTPYSLQHLPEADTVIVPSSRPCTLPVPDALLAALRDAYQRGARVISYCTGAFLLAAAGLLETTNESIERIATSCGFSSAATLRLHFQRLLRTSPQSYRTLFSQENRG